MNKDTKQNNYNSKFKGFHTFANQDFYLIGLGVLNQSEFILYTLIKGVSVDWDMRHFKYGTFNKNDLADQVKESLGWSSSKFNHDFRNLKTKKLIKCIDRKRKLYIVPSFVTQNIELKTSMKKRIFPDNPFFYLEEILDSFYRKKCRICNIVVEKLNEKVQKLNNEPNDYAFVKGIKNSIYRYNISSYKYNVGIEKVTEAKYHQRDEDVFPEEIPF